MSTLGIEATFGEVAKNEWARALREWVKFGQHEFESPNRHRAQRQARRDIIRIDDRTDPEKYNSKQLNDNQKYWADRWASQMNYPYWKERSQAEMTQKGVEARQLFYEGTKAYKTRRLRPGRRQVQGRSAHLEGLPQGVPDLPRGRPQQEGDRPDRQAVRARPPAARREAPRQLPVQGTPRRGQGRYDRRPFRRLRDDRRDPRNRQQGGPTGPPGRTLRATLIASWRTRERSARMACSLHRLCALSAKCQGRFAGRPRQQQPGLSRCRRAQAIGSPTSGQPSLFQRKRPDVEHLDAVELGVVIVMDEPLLLPVAKNRVVAWPVHPSRAGEHQRAPALEQGLAGPIQVRTGQASRAADHHLVIAVHTPAAVVERDEEIVELTVRHEKRRLDRTSLPARGQRDELKLPREAACRSPGRAVRA